MTEFSELVGLTLTEITGKKGEEKIQFLTKDGRLFEQYHSQDCCESVEVDEIHGDLADLIGAPITLAEEVTFDNEPNPDGKTGYDSYTWTFYKLATVKGHITIKWLGESSGYYSESVYFCEVTK